MTAPADATCPLVALLASRAPAPAPQPPPAVGPGGQPPRLLWTVEKAAERILVGKTKLYGLLANEALPSMMLGGRRVIAEQDLVEYVERLRGGWQPWSDGR